MDMIAGIVSFRGIEHVTRARFESIIDARSWPSPWITKTISGPNHVLHLSCPQGLWNGPNSISTSSEIMLATGADCHTIANSNIRQTISILKEWIDSGMIEDRYPENILNFSMAQIDLENNKLKLVTDHLGTSPIAYRFAKGQLAFSSNVSILYELYNDLSINDAAIFEFMTLGHFLGDKTHFNEIKLLPPGGLLSYSEDKITLNRYCRFEDNQVDYGLNLETAIMKVNCSLTEVLPLNSHPGLSKIYSFLSGGWDSRLLAGCLVRSNIPVHTVTTEQGVDVLERRMAAEVARILGLPNTYQAPDLFGYSTNFWQHAELTDYISDTGAWVIDLLKKISTPQVFIDGYLVDVLLRADKHVSPELIDLMLKENQDKLIDYYFNQIINQGGPFKTVKGGGQRWSNLLDPDWYNTQKTALRDTLNAEFSGAKHGTDIVTSFIVRNRQRRLIASLPVSIMGHYGAVLMPFTHRKLFNFSLQIPLKLKINGNLQKGLLNVIKPGLGDIISTNSPSHELKPFRTHDPLRRTIQKITAGIWIYHESLEKLDNTVYRFMRKSKSKSRLDLIKSPYQLQRLLFIQTALKSSPSCQQINNK